MLDIKNLQVRAENKEILKGINLRVNAGEVHAIMGPNGSGKSTLARALSGHPEYHVTGGEVLFEGRDLLDMDPDERAREGVFMAFQYPVEIAGVNNAYFLKAALNAKRKHHGEPELDAMEFMALIKSKSSLLDIDQSMLSRAVNEGFSGGEKKRNEIFQMALLEPKLAILDETDSGLDIDALKLVATGVNAMRGPERAFIVVTHYQRLLDYIVPDHVHVLSGGRIVRIGRQGTGAGAREEGLRLDRNQRAAGWSVRAMTQVAEKLQPWLAVTDERPRTGPRWLQDLRDRGRGAVRCARVPDRTRRRVAVHERDADRGDGIQADRRGCRAGDRGRTGRVPV